MPHNITTYNSEIIRGDCVLWHVGVYLFTELLNIVPSIASILCVYCRFCWFNCHVLYWPSVSQMITILIDFPRQIKHYVRGMENLLLYDMICSGYTYSVSVHTHARVIFEQYNHDGGAHAQCVRFIQILRVRQMELYTNIYKSTQCIQIHTFRTTNTLTHSNPHKPIVWQWQSTFGGTRTSIHGTQTFVIHEAEIKKNRKKKKQKAKRENSLNVAQRRRSNSQLETLNIQFVSIFILRFCRSTTTHIFQFPICGRYDFDFVRG